MARGSGWNYKRAFAEVLMRSPKEAEQPGRARTSLVGLAMELLEVRHFIDCTSAGAKVISIKDFRKFS